MLHGARWNSPGRRVIYAAETYAGALLEILVHASGSVPRSQGYVEIEIPSALSIEEITHDVLPRWDAPSFEATQAFGDVERNVLINQEHPEFPLVRASQAVRVRWDARLWKVSR